MKKRFLPLVLALCLLLSVSVSAVGTFQQGAQLSGIVSTENGALLVTDTYYKVLWEVSGEEVSQYAGVIPVADLSGEPQGVYHDAAVDQAFFMEPWAISPFLKGYAVSDTQAHVVRYVEDGRVYTLAGLGSNSSRNGNDKTGSFRSPTGLATSEAGELYVADTEGGSVRKIDTKGTVTTYVSGLTEPTGLCWKNGALYVAETGKNQIVKVTGGKTQVLAGVAEAAEEAGVYYGGFVDGPAATAEFDHPQGVAVGDDGTVYVADSGNMAVRMLRDGRVYTLAKSSNTTRIPLMPRGMLAAGETLYVADQYGGGILTLSLADKARFADVAETSWYADTVTKAVAYGLTNGTSETTFSPAASMTRSMFVTMLSRMHQCADGWAIIDGDATFPDVPKCGWYSGPARWAADEGVVNGISGKFQPTLDVSREQIVTMLYRYAQAQGYDVTGSADLRVFSDAASVSHWAQAAMAWAVDAGVVQGNGGMLSPGSSATRAQVATIFINFMDAYGL